MSNKKVIISGGGTAGHLYPAVCVGQKMKEKKPVLKIFFIGSHRKLEKKIIPHKFNFISLKIKGLMGKGWKILPSLFILPFSFLQSLIILFQIKPRLVIGVGGYSSGPVVLLASLLNIPTLIMEQNLRPGFTNRVLIPWVDKAVVAFKNSLPYFKGKGIFLGNPVREEFYSLPPKNHQLPLCLLIFGGSQGSHFLNKGIIKSLPLLQKENVKIFHQTGEKDYEWVKKAYAQEEEKGAVIAPYFSPMVDYFAKADLIISRAGATTIAELIAAQKASLLIPFSKATENHQLLNARELEKINGAEIIEEKEFTPGLLVNKIHCFVNNPEKIKHMENNLKILKTQKVAEKISELCFHLMDKKKRRNSVG